MNKLAQLKAVTEASAVLVTEHAAAVQDAKERLDAAKALLRQLDAVEQARIVVNDTPLPELIARHELAVDQYETTCRRHETNQRYLKLLQEKANLHS